jgi:hypothetical protein
VLEEGLSIFAFDSNTSVFKKASEIELLGKAWLRGEEEECSESEVEKTNHTI